MATSILPERKYYGTIVKLKQDKEFNIWIGPDHEYGEKGYLPSERQAKQDGYQSPQEAWKDGYYSDSHYETKLCYEISEIVAKALTENGF